LRLLLNIYAPAQGAVLIDGVAVGQMDPLSLRRQIGFVPQDVTLFHGDIKENILLGSTNVDDAQLLEAVRLACLEETLQQLPNGLATQVGERGDRLSGGQRQAVAIARALVQRPKLILMDEPSSMMDPATEQLLINNLRRLSDVTLLLVSHRTAMLPLMDRLVVVDQGRVLLDGPRDEVLKRLQVSAQQAAVDRAVNA
jgi:ATP-binding cassette subfamily C protein LapB